jgi:hypothetical protein
MDEILLLDFIFGVIDGCMESQKTNEFSIYFSNKKS